MFSRQVPKFAEELFGNDFCDISALRCVRNLSVLLDSNMSMKEQIKSTAKNVIFKFVMLVK